MPPLSRNEIAWDEKFRRCLYFFLRDELDKTLVTEGLIESYRAFKANDKEYPFAEMRELKPRAKVIAKENPLHRHFIVMFYEETLPPECKNHIRFFDSNKVTKENVCNIADFDLTVDFYQRMKYFEDREFAALLKNLINSDYAVLIQRDQSIKTRNRYIISHFHVRIDWPVADAAEDLGRYLRYISKNLYERGDRHGEILQQKLFEYYGCHHLVGGRRTAGLVAARFLGRFDQISTVYILSSEARTLVRLSERGISKYVLVKISGEDIKGLAQTVGLKEKEFVCSYMIDRTPEYGVGILLVTYQHNEHSLPPWDGKLRELNPDYHWLNVNLQLLIPPPSSPYVRPIPYPIIYA
jgi:hypothetical protein